MLIVDWCGPSYHATGKRGRLLPGLTDWSSHKHRGVLPVRCQLSVLQLRRSASQRCW
jgi:hypothetical protein